MSNQQDLGFAKSKEATGPVECLGITFEHEAARRAHFLGLLREKLQDPEFRKTPGFPNGSDEAILRMSDPPYYTACPNPFLAEFVRLYGKPYDSNERYEREPFAVDVSVGKTDQLFQLHSYHTKVPYLAIVPSILHYTRPGDVVLDGFCGSGMTGLAAQWCGLAPQEYQKALETLWKAEGRTAPEWGFRRAVLNDLGPAATFISAGFNLPFDADLFESVAERIFGEVEQELGWMYEVLHTDGKTRGRLNYAVWSEVFSCPECGGEVNFLAESSDEESTGPRKEFACPHCGAELTKKRLDRYYVTIMDKLTGESRKLPKRVPVLVNYNVGASTHERPTNAQDIEILSKIDELPVPAEVPTAALPYMHMTHERARLDAAGVTNVHHFFLPRAAHAIALLWRKAHAVQDARLRRMAVFLAEQSIWTMALLNRFQPQGFKQVNKFLNGVYYVPSIHCEISPSYALAARGNRIARAMAKLGERPSSSIVSTGDCAALPVGSASIDYIFTDPPFGENIYYSDLNFLVEAWHGVLTNATHEAIIDQAKKKGVPEYQELMLRCFEEYHRVLKPGRWMTVVFSNSSNVIWRAIQEAMGAAGFVIADVRTLDKKQGSYRQVTSSAVKQDLVISAYKPTEALSHRFELGESTTEAAWTFVKEHLRNVPVFVGSAKEASPVVERTAQRLLDRMIAFHVQRGLTVPISAPEFLQGLSQRFPMRDEMYFLPDQVAEYDRKRTSVGELRQLSLFVNDEASAIQWVRQQLQDKPQSFQDLQPQFQRETQTWAKHEKTMELRHILEASFDCYKGKEDGPVPSQIHRYLSTNFKDLRNLEKEDPLLVEKARNRWYVLDPNKQADRDRLRERALLKEFEEYKTSTARKLKIFRTEAVRAGFKACWQEREFGTIIKVAEKLPESVLQEDNMLCMFYDNARTLLGDE